MSKIIDIQKAAELLAVDYKTVYRLIQHGELPAAKIGRVYRLDQDDVERYFARRKAATMRDIRANGRRDSRSGASAAPKPAERRCSWCGRALVLNYSVAAECHEPGCDALICRDCSRAGEAEFCPVHVQPGDRNEQLERLHVEGRLVVSDAELRVLAAAYLGQVAARIQALSTWPLDGGATVPRAGLNVTVYQPHVEDWLGIGGEDSAPFESTIARRGAIRSGAKLLDLHLLPALHRIAYERYGFDVQPLSAIDLRSLVGRAEPPRRGSKAHLVALWSPTGWTKQAAAHTDHVVLVDQPAASCAGSDAWLDYLLNPADDADALDECERFARRELTTRSSVRLDTLVDDGGFHREIARRCIERMAADGDYGIEQFDNLGLVLSRR